MTNKEDVKKTLASVLSLNKASLILSIFSALSTFIFFIIITVFSGTWILRINIDNQNIDNSIIGVGIFIILIFLILFGLQISFFIVWIILLLRILSVYNQNSKHMQKPLILHILSLFIPFMWIASYISVKKSVQNIKEQGIEQEIEQDL